MPLHLLRVHAIDADILLCGREGVPDVLSAHQLALSEALSVQPMYLLDQFLDLLPQLILTNWCCAWREVQVDFPTRSSFNIAL